MSTFEFWWGIGILLLVTVVYSYIFINAYKRVKGCICYRFILAVLLLVIDAVFITGMVIVYRIYMGLI